MMHTLALEGYQHAAQAYLELSNPPASAHIGAGVTV